MNFVELDACVRSLHSEMIDFTSELVAIASENPPGHAYPECVRTIESRLRSLELPCEVVTYRPAKGMRDDSGAAVVLSGVGAGQRTLYFSGHYDVVPVTTPGQCTPVLKGKALFGRGSADMKSGLASMLFAAAALQRVRMPLGGRVGLVFVPDEETGGHRGSGFLAATKRLGAHGIGMLTPEPTSGVVWNANRGAITVRVTVHGREAHVGLLHQGRNAFEDAIASSPACSAWRDAWLGVARSSRSQGPPDPPTMTRVPRGVRAGLRCDSERLPAMSRMTS